MSKHASSSSTSYGAWALAAWLAALALFLIWLGWVLFSTSPIEGKAEKPPLPGVAQSDPGTVLDNLPAKGSLTAPNMPFTASQEYVLTGAGLQGFYQTSAPNDVWTLSYPEPQLNAQVMGSNSDPFYGAKTVVVVLVDRSVPTHLEDGSLAMGNLLNAAYALGVDSCWIHRAHEVFDSPEGLELLASWGLPADGSLRGVGNCILGYAEDTLPEPKPRRDNIIYVR